MTDGSYIQAHEFSTIDGLIFSALPREFTKEFDIFDFEALPWGQSKSKTHCSQCVQGKRLQSEASPDCMDAHNGNAYTVGCHDGSGFVCTVAWWNVVADLVDRIFNNQI